MKKFDFIFTGGGLSGLTTAYFLSLSRHSFKSALIIDKEEKEGNDRTWCFWSEIPSDFEPLVSKTWHQLSFACGEFRTQDAISGPGYRLIRSRDYYQFIKNALQKDGRFQWSQASVASIRSNGEKACVSLLDSSEYEADMILNSVPSLALVSKSVPGSTFLWQHFRGWVVESEKAVFDPEVPVLMDFFEGTAAPEARFFYVLPFDERSALIEYTVFSPRLLADAVYDEKLDGYIRTKLGLKQWKVKEVEQGAIPMTDRRFSPYHGENILNIGTAGGWVKPSTGYAFTRTLDRSCALAEALALGKDPGFIYRERKRFRFYDKLLLNILNEESHHAGSIFLSLFQRNRMDHILRFLEERSRIPAEVRIFSRLPVGVFLRALRRVYLPGFSGLTKKYRKKLKIRYRYDY